MKKVLMLMMAGGLVVAGCGGDDDDTPAVATTVTSTTTTTATTTTEDVADAGEAAKAYFDAMATGDPAVISGMLDHAHPGSDAELYAHFQIAQAESGVAEGLGIATESASTKGDAIEICSEGSDCTTFGDFVADGGTGKLTTFSVDGTPIAGRLVAGGATAQGGGAEIELLVAYRSVTSGSGDGRGGLSVALDVRNGDQANTVYGASAEYVGPDGRQVQAVDAQGATDLRAGAASKLVVLFADVEAGGTLYLPGYAGSDSWEVTFQL